MFLNEHKQTAGSKGKAQPFQFEKVRFDCYYVFTVKTSILAEGPEEEEGPATGGGGGGGGGGTVGKVKHNRGSNLFPKRNWNRRSNYPPNFEIESANWSSFIECYKY